MIDRDFDYMNLRYDLFRVQVKSTSLEELQNQTEEVLPMPCAVLLL